MKLAAGARIGAYTLEQHIGGATSDVYRARDERLERTVALKFLRGTSERMRAEANAVARLKHPHIVGLLEVFEHDGRLCLVQEWIDGGNLRDRMAGGPMGLDETLRMGIELAAALGHAHRNGILHRDIDPSNVLITVRGDYKLADFGAVGRLEQNTGLTKAGTIAGTPLYMSPEQLTGAEQSPASDLFGLGMLLFQGLHGRLPFAGENYFQLVQSRMQPIAVPPSPLQDLLRRLLSYEPANRPSSADEVEYALTRLRTELISGKPPSGQEPGAGTGAHKPIPPDAPRPTPPPRRSSPVRGVVAAFVAVVLVVLGLWLIDPSGQAVRIGAGVVIIGLAVVLALQIRRRWASRSPEIERQATELLFGARDRDQLTESLVIEIDQVVANLIRLDKKLLGMTLVATLQQFLSAKKWSHRQQALLDLIAVLEKVMDRISPWHVRHKEAIAVTVGVIGALTGIATAVSGFLG